MGKFDGWLLASDADGTLYKDQYQIPPGNRKAIIDFEQDGGIFTLATGRSVEAARAIAKDLNLRHPVIVYNGAGIYDFTKESYIRRVCLPQSARKIVRHVYNRYPGIAIEIHCDKILYILHQNQTCMRHLDHAKVEYKNIPLSEAEPLSWNKILFAAPPEEMAVFKAEISALPHDGITMIASSDFYYEMIPFGCDKGGALKWLRDFYHLKKENTAGIGNYYNDESLAEAAGTGAFVKDSPEMLKAAADYVTTRPSGEDAIAEFIGYLETTFDIH